MSETTYKAEWRDDAPEKYGGWGFVKVVRSTVDPVTLIFDERDNLLYSFSPDDEQQARAVAKVILAILSDKQIAADARAGGGMSVDETANDVLILPSQCTGITFHGNGETLPAGTSLIGLPVEHLQAMAKLWLMKDEIEIAIGLARTRQMDWSSVLHSNAGHPVFPIEMKELANKLDAALAKLAALDPEN